MIYKILLIRNRTKEKYKVQKYLDWFSKYTPLEIVCDETNTDFDVKTEIIGNATYHGAVCDSADLIPKLKIAVPEGKYNAVVFYCGNKLDDIRVSCVNGTGGAFPLYPDTELIQLRTISDNGIDLNHELFHAFFKKANKCQIPIVDNMDTYIGNTDLSIDNIVNTNREIALKSLVPYWEKICAFRNLAKQSANIAPLVTLKRFSDNGVETLGELTYGAFKCKTLERHWKENTKNISCIPKGTYQCKYTFSPKFLKWTYELVGVPNRSGIRIHSGNYFFDIEGCILLGSGYSDINNDKQTDVVNSRITISNFEQFMDKKPFTLKVV